MACTTYAVVGTLGASCLASALGGTLGIDPYVTGAMLTALAVGVAGCWWLIGQAARMGLVDHPIGRKDHERPTPVVGGIAIFLAVCCGWSMLPGFTLGSSAFGLLLGGGMLIVVGVLDDLRDLKWHSRILVQSAAALTICWFGAELHSLSLPDARPSLSLGWASMAFTAFGVVGIVNAVNMIDGVDGLAGSIVAATLLVMAALAYWTGLTLLGSLLMVATAAIGAYLVFNLRLPGRPKALTFLGNSGSALLGLLVAWSAIELTQAPTARVTPSVAPWLVGLPILDCLTLIGRRLAGGRSPFSADRMHFHHLLLDRGFSVPRVVFAGLVLHLAIAGGGLGLMLLGVPDLALIAGFLGVLGVYAITVSLYSNGSALTAPLIRGERDASR